MGFKKALLATIMALSVQTAVHAESITPQTSIQQIRSSTLKLNIGNSTFLVDPMLGAKGAYPSFPDTPNGELRNPLVELPMSPAEVVKGVDAVFVTHTHIDHWDAAAQHAIPKTMPIYVQNVTDQKLIKEQGFTEVIILSAHEQVHGVSVTRVAGSHIAEEFYAIPKLKQDIGEVMGLVFQASGSPSVYVASDTVLTKEVKSAIHDYKPDAIVLATGGARSVSLHTNLLMDFQDVSKVHAIAPKAKIIGVHMNAVNPTTISREDLLEYARKAQMTNSVLAPKDGEVINL